MNTWLNRIAALFFVVAGLCFAPHVASAADAAKNEEQEFAAAGIADSDLDEYRGTFSASSLSYLLATNSGNTITNPVSGANTISQGALSQNMGITTVLQNSGNGVIIQNSTNVSVTFVSAP